MVAQMFAVSGLKTGEGLLSDAGPVPWLTTLESYAEFGMEKVPTLSLRPFMVWFL